MTRTPPPQFPPSSTPRGRTLAEAITTAEAATESLKARIRARIHASRVIGSCIMTTEAEARAARYAASHHHTAISAEFAADGPHDRSMVAISSAMHALGLATKYLNCGQDILAKLNTKFGGMNRDIMRHNGTEIVRLADMGHATVRMAELHLYDAEKSRAEVFTVAEAATEARATARAEAEAWAAEARAEY